jgi:glycosyltransferase involved in cell wall biosynthesis
MPCSTTVAVVPRESFSTARSGVEALLRVVPPDARVVLVDGGSPRGLRRYLATTAVENDFTLLRADRLLSPNEARNAVLPFVDTDFVLFLDYETQLPPGAVEALEACARANDAAIVGPIYLEQFKGSMRVHMAGGQASFTEQDGGRHFIDRHEDRVAGASLPTAPAPTEHVEFHCMLVRREVFDQVGPLDEQMLSLREHSDFCLSVREAGGSVWFDPDVAATYARPRLPTLADIGFCLVRWSDEWNRKTVEHFNRKWGVADDDPATNAILVWARGHRRFCYRPYLSLVGRALGSRRAAFYDAVDRRAQRLARRWYREDRPRPTPVSVAHAATWMSRAGADA